MSPRASRLMTQQILDLIEYQVNTAGTRRLLAELADRMRELDTRNADLTREVERLRSENLAFRRGARRAA